ncbi:Mut7-C RNAse domain-containing protein [Candidatus Borrarchaeum sp.]|uniref:Mut7-C RNAse domain-containing protein n=1 Tax=Candidatus Borrarchaeum sp. TaxID=2846742 RepID=UPI00257A291D|nr:Mut7-C RNAse domain-containing protein [Candidatus Borrarchaeum sp.]
MEKLSPKFVVDSMLGRLARWLRLIGYDTLYFKIVSDEELLERTRSENRFLLTRDKRLHQQAIREELHSILIPVRSNSEVLAFLSKTFNIQFDIDPSSSRCPLCNGKITSAEKENIKSKIPTPTFKKYDQFWQCIHCGKIYWMGKHYKSMRKIIAEIGSSI